MILLGKADQVILESLRVTTHVLGRQLAKSMNGEELQARWLGDGILAVAGQKYDSAVDENGNETSSQTPLGLRLNLEARSKELMETKRDEVLAAIRS